MKILLLLIFNILISKFSSEIIEQSMESNTILGQCNIDNCPTERGICDTEDKCVCFNGFKTFFGNKEDIKTYCNYKQKSMVIALVLELVISFGLGHFYLGNSMYGTLKNLYCFVSVFFIFIFPLLIKRSYVYRHTNYVALLQGLVVLSFMIWQILDCLGLGMKIYRDSNNIELFSW